VPAWACMMSSRDPGQLGIYGFARATTHDGCRSPTPRRCATSRSGTDWAVWACRSSSSACRRRIRRDRSTACTSAAS
jgi:predicted AlkP superfamily phosphohydrolase/phosphomutase